jgi:hypothetical protein
VCLGVLAGVGPRSTVARTVDGFGLGLGFGFGFGFGVAVRRAVVSLGLPALLAGGVASTGTEELGSAAGDRPGASEPAGDAASSAAPPAAPLVQAASATATPTPAAAIAIRRRQA